MNRCLIAGLCTTVCLLALTTAVRSQEGGGGDMKMPSADEMKEMMERWQKAMTPGPQHAELCKSVGKYDITMKVWMAGPGGPPTETKGTAEIKAIHGGRFIVEEMSYEMMMPNASGGMDKLPTTGFSLTGYNNFRGMYETVWCDSVNTHILKLSGMTPPGSNTMTMYGEMDEPMMNVVGRTIKAVSRVVDADHFIFELYDLHAGDNYKVIEIAYARKK